MALTMWKWTAAATVACSVFWIWLFRDQRPDSTIRPYETNRTSRIASSPAVSGELNRAVDRLRLLQIRDSIAGLPSKPVDGLTVLIDAGYGEPLQRALEAKLRQGWGRAARRGGIPVVVAAVIDSSSTVLGYPRGKLSKFALPISTFLPTRETGARCISVVRLPMVLDAHSPKYIPRNLLSPESIDGLLSPCVYYATFGTPGPQIEKWLRDGSWRVSHHADWSTSAPRWDTDRVAYLASAFGPLASRTDPAWATRFVLTPRGIACLGGASGRCVEATSSTRAVSEDSTWSANVVSSYGTTQFSFYGSSMPTNLGPYDGWLLSEMARTLGDAKFAAFWRARTAVPEAFRAASGQELDGWIRNWGRDIYGSLAIGPGMPLSSIASGLVIIGLAMSVAISIARRRRVA